MTRQQFIDGALQLLSLCYSITDFTFSFLCLPCLVLFLQLFSVTTFSSVMYSGTSSSFSSTIKVLVFHVYNISQNPMGHIEYCVNYALELCIHCTCRLTDWSARQCCILWRWRVCDQGRSDLSRTLYLQEIGSFPEHTTIWRSSLFCVANRNRGI